MHAVGDVAVVGLILAGGVAIVGGDGRGLRGGQHLYGEGLGNGLDAGETVLGELDGDGTGRGLVAIDGDLAILDATSLVDVTVAVVPFTAAGRASPERTTDGIT